jgi:hypothetical protein
MLWKIWSRKCEEKKYSLATFFLAQLNIERNETHTHTLAHTITRNNFMLGFQKFMHIFVHLEEEDEKKT